MKVIGHMSCHKIGHLHSLSTAVGTPVLVGDSSRIGMLDGWRAISILAVLAGHWLPLGPSQWQFNTMVPAAGMALFFTLSGLLIVQLLLRDDRVVPFLIRRLFRIVPLAWAAMIILAIATQPDSATLAANLAFFSNLPPARLMEGGQHLWSLCIEAQFYAMTALLVLLAGRKGLFLLPFVGLAVTGLRIAGDQTISITTWHRVDEILAGAALGLIVSRRKPGAEQSALPVWTPLVFGFLLLAAAHPDLAALNYARPYLAAAAIGTSLYVAPQWFDQLLTSRAARYVAGVSYALYVVHGMLTATWLGGEGASTTTKYSRRPLLIAATFALAHLSTRCFEKRWIRFGKRLIKKFDERHSRETAIKPGRQRS